MRAKTIIGCREWLALPDLGVPGIFAKVDTGAETSALHAYKIKVFEEGGVRMAQFDIHPVQRRKKPCITCVSPIVDERCIRSSNGSEERRYVIRTKLVLGPHSYQTDITLTNREEMGYRMLLGRKSLKKRFLVDPAGRCAYGDHDHSDFYTIPPKTKRKKIA